jgi:hypothetical protein
LRIIAAPAAAGHPAVADDWRDRLRRFAGLAGLPSVFRPGARAAWLNIVPEFNPYKYNSLKCGGKSSWLVAGAGMYRAGSTE